MLFEIATIESKGRIKVNTGLETFLSEAEARFVVLPITGRVCVQATSSRRLPERPGRSRHRSDCIGGRNSSGHR